MLTFTSALKYLSVHKEHFFKNRGEKLDYLISVYSEDHTISFTRIFWKSVFEIILIVMDKDSYTMNFSSMGEDSDELCLLHNLTGYCVKISEPYFLYFFSTFVTFYS